MLIEMVEVARLTSQPFDRVRGSALERSSANRVRFTTFFVY
jgi:hypothetical protein